MYAEIRMVSPGGHRKPYYFPVAVSQDGKGKARYHVTVAKITRRLQPQSDGDFHVIAHGRRIPVRLMEKVPEGAKVEP